MTFCGGQRDAPTIVRLKENIFATRGRPQHRTHAIPLLFSEDQQRSSTKGDCMSYQTIVALDLGKFKTVLCVMDVATRTHRFATIDSTPQAIGKTVKQHVSVDPAQTLVV